MSKMRFGSVQNETFFAQLGSTQQLGEQGFKIAANLSRKEQPPPISVVRLSNRDAAGWPVKAEVTLPVETW